MRREALAHAFLLRTYQARVARHIGDEYRGGTAGRCYSSGIPALRRPATIVASHRARTFGTMEE